MHLKAIIVYNQDLSVFIRTTLLVSTLSLTTLHAKLCHDFESRSLNDAGYFQLHCGQVLEAGSALDYRHNPPSPEAVGIGRGAGWTPMGLDSHMQ